MKSNSDIDDQLAPEVRNQLLLYWSGELASDDKKAVEERLLPKSECRRYLLDLEELKDTFEAQGPPLAPSRDVAAQAVARFASSMPTVEEFGRAKKGIIQLTWLKPLAVAAAIALTGFIGFQIGQQGGGIHEKRVAEQVDIPEVSDDLPSASSDVIPVGGRSRSARLFAAESRGADARLDATRRHLNKLKSKVRKS